MAFYLYCIGERGEFAPLFEDALPEAIESGAKIELVIANDLAGVVSAVPLEDYDEAPLHARLNDAGWTAVRALRHEGVVEHFASRAATAPLRFGTIYLSRERIKQMLFEKEPELRQVLEMIIGREEWGVNIYRDRARLLEAITSISPRLMELSKQAEAASPGQGYLLKKKIETMKADEAREFGRRVVEEIERSLVKASEGARRLRVLKDEAMEQGDVMAKLALLVERARFDEFRKAAEALADKYSGSGFKLELTGPWPVYNFASKTGETDVASNLDNI